MKELGGVLMRQVNTWSILYVCLQEARGLINQIEEDVRACMVSWRSIKKSDSIGCLPSAGGFHSQFFLHGFCVAANSCIFGFLYSYV